MTYAINATYCFVLPHGLPRDMDGQLRALAGPRIKKGNGAVWAAYSHAYLVQGLLDARGVPYRLEAPDGLHVPSPWGDEGEAQLRERLAVTSLRPWLYNGKAEPIRNEFSLARFQRESIWFAAERGGGFWHIPPGGGKTASSITWAELIRTRPYGYSERAPILIITKNAVTYQFTKQINRFVDTEALELPTPSECPVRNKVRLTLREVLDAYLEERQEADQPAYVVTGWGSIRTQLETLLDVPWCAVVMDESHLTKGMDRWEFTRDREGNWAPPNPKDTVTCAAYRIASKVPHRLAMTATPIPNRREDLWAQLSLVELSGWGMTATNWLKRFCDAKPGQHGGLDTSGVSNTEELQTRMAFTYHQVTAAECKAELPPCRVQAIYIAEKHQDKPAAGFKREMTRLAKLSAKGDKQAKGQLEELQLMEAATRKRSATMELVEEYVGGAGQGASKGKVVIFTGRHQDCVELGEIVQKRFKGVKVWVGSEEAKGGNEDPEGVKEGAALPHSSYAPMSKEARNQVAEEYMAHPGPCVLIGTGYAWGTGIDMHDSDLLAIVMLPYDPGNFEQWTGRVERLGMNRPCSIALMVATGTVDERKVLSLTEKITDQVKLVNQEGMQRVHDTLLGFDDLDNLLDGVVDKVNNPPTETLESFWESIWS